jgi:hypothetical protein
MREANATIDVKAREKLLQQAETLLIRDEVPIIPLFIYVGLEYYDSNEWEGIYPNIRAEHPVRAIRRKKEAAVAVQPQAGGAARREALKQ